MKKHDPKFFPQLIAELVKAFASANHKMSLMTDCEDPLREEYYNNSYNDLSKKLRELNVIMLDDNEVEFFGTNGITYHWSRKDPANLVLKNHLEHRNFFERVITNPKLSVKEFKFKELPVFFEHLYSFLRTYINQFHLLENQTSNEADDLHSKLYNELYEQIKAMGIIMISDHEFQIKAEDNNYYRWSYNCPNVISVVSKNRQHREYDAKKTYLDDLK